MWQSLGHFFGSQIGKIGAVSIKTWHAVMAGVVILTTASASGVILTRRNEQRTVVVLINGIQTQLTGCRYNGDATSNAPFSALKRVLATEGYSDPYAQGCPGGAMPYTGSPLDTAEYSYAAPTPGHMVGDHWIPANFSACAPNTNTLDQDMLNLETLIESYRAVYPNARFILVGHSLGGLVALAGARYYAQKHGGSIISKVITLDSPLHGRAVPIDSPLNAQLGYGCPNPSSLGTLLNSTAQSQIGLAEDFTRKLAQTGTAVYTLGNLDDCLYQAGACVAQGDATPDAIDTQFVTDAYVREYHLGSDGQWPGGHGAILSDSGALQEVRWIVAEAPAVTAAVATPPGQDATLRVIVDSRWGIQEVKAEVIGAEFATISANKPITLRVDGSPTMLDRTVALDTPTLPNGKLLVRVTAVVDGLGRTHLAQADADPTSASIDQMRDFKAQVEFTNVNYGRTFGTAPVGQTTLPTATTSTLHPVLHGTITEFSLPSHAYPEIITRGPDGNLWFTEVGPAYEGVGIGRITPQGTITEFALPPSRTALGIATGPDGNLWLTEEVSGGNGAVIGRMTTSGVLTEFTVPAPFMAPEGITAGPDGSLWFTDGGGNSIGRITTSGSITVFTLPTANLYTQILDITAGPDGNLWFTESSGTSYSNGKIGRITPEGTITEFPLPTLNSSPYSITAGPDSNLWFTENDGSRIGRITPGGTITEFPLPSSGYDPEGIASGPDGNLWFTENMANKVAHISPSGVITELDVPTATSHPTSITAGPDDSLWFTEGIGGGGKEATQGGQKIGRIT